MLRIYSVAKRFWADESGQSMLEYALIIGLVSAVLATVALSPLGQSLRELFRKIKEEIASIYPGRPDGESPLT